MQPNLHLTYKHSGVKPYFKENRALRTEATINNPQDFGVGKDLSNWTYLRKLAAAINQRLLDTERVSQDCLLSAESFARVSEPTTTHHRAPGLRFGQPRVMALFAALSRFAPALNGFRHGDLRPIVQAMLNAPPHAYTASQMSYDLRPDCTAGGQPYLYPDQLRAPSRLPDDQAPSAYLQPGGFGPSHSGRRPGHLGHGVSGN